MKLHYRANEFFIIRCRMIKHLKKQQHCASLLQEEMDRKRLQVRQAHGH